MTSRTTRGPTTTTLRAIERVLQGAAAPMSRYEIRQCLATQIAAPLLDEGLAYLAEHGLVQDEGPGGKVVWVGPAGHSVRGRPASGAEMRPPRKVPTKPGASRLAALVRSHRREILALAAKHGVVSVRLFGSVARGDDDAASDVDLLVRLEPGRSLLDHIAFKQDVEDLLKVRADVVSEGGISPYIRDAVLNEAIPV